MYVNWETTWVSVVAEDANIATVIQFDLYSNTVTEFKSLRDCSPYERYNLHTQKFKGLSSISKGTISLPGVTLSLLFKR